MVRQYICVCVLDKIQCEVIIRNFPPRYLQDINRNWWMCGLHITRIIILDVYCYCIIIYLSIGFCLYSSWERLIVNLILNPWEDHWIYMGQMRGTALTISGVFFSKTQWPRTNTLLKYKFLIKKWEVLSSLGK